MVCIFKRYLMYRYLCTSISIYPSTYIYQLSALSYVQLFVILEAVACQTPLSVAFSRQEYWSGLPFPFPGNLPNPGVKPMSPALAGGFFATEPLGKLYQLSECMLSSLSHVWLFATLWTIALQAPLSMGILQARILGWVAISFSNQLSTYLLIY